MNRARIEASAERADQALRALALVLEEEGAPADLVEGNRAYIVRAVALALRLDYGPERRQRHLWRVK